MTKIIQLIPSKSMRSKQDIDAMRKACMGNPLAGTIKKALGLLKPYQIENDPLES